MIAVGSTSPRQVLLGCIREQAEPASEWGSATVLQLLPRAPALVSLMDAGVEMSVNPFLPKLFLVSVSSQ